MKRVITIVLAVLALTAPFAPSVQADAITVHVGNFDGDSCNDREEQGQDPVLGGMRDPTNGWDFLDVPTGSGSNLARDAAVSGNDIFAVIGRFNATDTGPGDFDRTSDPSSTPNPAVPGVDRANYHPAYDRTSPAPGADPWDLGPPDGAISALEIFAALAQFGHTCQGPFDEKVDLSQDCDSIVKVLGEPVNEFELLDGEKHQECFLVLNPETGDVVDVYRMSVDNQGAVSNGEAEEEIPPDLAATYPTTATVTTALWGYYTCSSDYKYESLVFRTDLAEVKVILKLMVVLRPSNPYYGVVLERDKWKEVHATWPWSVTNRNNQITTVYVVPFKNLKAQTYSGFHAEWSIPMPFGIPPLQFSEDMEIHVSTRGGLDGSGVFKCWDRGWHT